jgi:hypothetical protein
VPPKSYSVDEMLTQLRSSDGHKRRRRTDQPVYTHRRRRRLVIGLVLGIASLAVAGYFGFRFFQRLRLEGETFRQSLNRRVSDAVGCQVELTRVHEGGEGSLSATEARFETHDQDLLEAGTFSELNASLTKSSWASNEWGITVLSINRGSVQLNPQRPAAPVGSTSRVPRPSQRERSSGGGFRFGISPEPDIITLDGIRFTHGLDVVWPSSKADEKPEALRGLRGHAKLRAGGSLEGAFVEGTVSLNLLPELRIEHLQWKLTGRELEIPGARVVFGGDARAEITGKASLMRDGSVDLNVSFVETPLKSLLPVAWHERVLGKFASKNVRFHAGFSDGPDRALEGAFTVTGCVLRGIPFANKLADALGSPELAILEFPLLAGQFKWSPSAGLEITGLSGEREGVLRFSGNVSVNPNGAVKGQLKAEASESALLARGSGAPTLFGPVSDGWAAVEFSVSGTAAVISDTLRFPETGAVPAVPGRIPDNTAPAPSVPAPNPGVSAPAPGVAPPTAPPSPGPPAPTRRPRLNDAQAEKAFNDLLEP